MSEHDSHTVHRETDIVHGSIPYDAATGAVSVPIYQSATFRHPALHETTGFDYSRGLNPTRSALESAVALLERGRYGLAFSSGMGAISALIKLFSPGDHLIVSADLYGGTWRLFNDYYAKYGLRFSWVDTSDPGSVRSALTPETRCVFIETPSNPMMKVTDIRRMSDLIHSHRPDAYLAVDNTFLTPYFQNPLSLGADFAVHSGTKYLGGHNDALSGFLVHSDGSLEDSLRNIQMSEGASLSPFDAWLVLRGMKTLAVRMDRQSENALKIARWLRGHPKVDSVFYPGFEDHPQHGLSLSQSRGFGGMVSFYLKDPHDAEKMLKSVKLILFAESLGGVETLITYPVEQTHKAIPSELRERSGVNERLMRLSVGIEHADDLIADLDQALF
ncbi:PLP-dependent aspartate aminotransferase family protein [Treponema zuelzerae]|uniref:PLP-dependent aspartate aminotransferase family protein n=1 Tax=Teretinema zuelzerae TaxID=156 RepID=A0AAE3JK99_9SPIR|nr:PLP-dependent aspartate aminotransferase family protein [Teretinema zuelzerae]MCD1653759.1 PLP-dependent aspartate aminotransferase family protein [Teretinema zuelzerae]